MRIRETTSPTTSKTPIILYLEIKWAQSAIFTFLTTQYQQIKVFGHSKI